MDIFDRRRSYDTESYYILVFSHHFNFWLRSIAMMDVTFQFLAKIDRNNGCNISIFG